MDGVTSTIEYAVEVLKVRHVVLCGHSDCGALKAALHRKSLEKLPKSSRWLSHVEAAFSHRQPLRPEDGDQAELCSIIRGNVVAQLINLRAQPSVADAPSTTPSRSTAGTTTSSPDASSATTNNSASSSPCSAKAVLLLSCTLEGL